MPARLLREGILDSDAVCSLSFPAEVFYRRLMSVVDDFGRFDGRAAVLKSRLYPLQGDKVREADIPRWIAECEKAGLIVLYTVAAKPYILFRKLGVPRAKESKWPAPPESLKSWDTSGCEVPCESLFADENGCEQTHTDESRRQHTPAYAPDSGSDTSSDAGAGTKKSRPATPAVVIVTFPTDGNPGEWHLTESHVAEWRDLYPTLDILAECRKALAWVQSKPSNRKTAGGMKRFLVGWLNRATERGGRQQPQAYTKPAGETPLERMQRLQAEMDANKGGNP
ncbi:MAG: hypothetical protein ACOVT5_09885 [Armatimonadaceae bacterium]